MNLYGDNSGKKLLGGYLYPSTKLLRESYSASYDGKIELEFPWNFNESYEDFVYTNNGSTAAVLLYTQVLKLGKGDIVYLPEYICGTVLDSVHKSGAGVRFYKQDESLNVNQEDFEKNMDEDVRLIYVVHYFGALQLKESMDFFVRMGEKYHVPIAEDISISAFSYLPDRVARGEYLLCGIRKWFPVPDGGFLAFRKDVVHGQLKLQESVDDVLYQQIFLAMWRENILRKEKEETDEFLLRQDTKNARRYRELIPREMSEITRRILRQYPVQESLEIRKRNYKTLTEYLESQGIKLLWNELEEGCVPYGMVVLLPERDQVVRGLREKGILAQIQWFKSQENNNVSEAVNWIYEHNLMIQCDQRYGKEDMREYGLLLCTENDKTIAFRNKKGK